MNVPAGVLHVCGALRAAGFEAWLVGGCVRDGLMGRDPHDWDIATNARPEQTAATFEHTVLTGAKHGTVTVILDDERFEVTTFRSDGTYTDGRHPDGVRFVATIEEDLARRDFTMNAIAYDPIAPVLGGEWRDPWCGKDDILNERVRAVGKPKDRFDEDALRILRAIRFCATLGFTLSKSTANGLDACKEKLLTIAPERVHDELHKTMLAERPSLALHIGSSIFGLVIPELLPMLGCSQNKYHRYDVWTHTMRVLDATPRDDVALRFAGLFHDIAKPQTKGVNPETGDATFYNHEEVGAEVTDGILRRLKFSNDERERIVHHVRHHLIPYEPGWSAAAIRRWVRRVGAANVKSICSLGRADIAGKGGGPLADRGAVLDELEGRIANMTIHAPIVSATAQLAIGGADVMSALGIGPGPRVGQELRRLVELVLDEPERNTREELLAALTA